MCSCENNVAGDQRAAAEAGAIQIQTSLPGELTSSSEGAADDFRAPHSAFYCQEN